MYTIITGTTALSYAEAKGLKFLKVSVDLTNPSQDHEMTLVSLDKAKKIATEFPDSIYLEFRGWSSDNTDVYFIGEYFADGKYLGPDFSGLEPIFE